MNSRSPCGERGLKCQIGLGGLVKEVSLPVRGAWIEMPRPANHSTPAPGRSPCGERGLKWKIIWMDVRSGKSLPVRGAWIEITRF